MFGVLFLEEDLIEKYVLFFKIFIIFFKIIYYLWILGKFLNIVYNILLIKCLINNNVNKIVFDYCFVCLFFLDVD